MKTLFSIALLLVGTFANAQGTVSVPTDQPTIQAGIDAANNGDTVMVSAGTYFENLNFHGKVITVSGTDGPKNTIIDGGQKDAVVIFNSGEGRGTILTGFTITHGFASGIEAQGSGGGIAILGASPSIIHNVITENSACSQGGGIYVLAGAPLIAGNVISKNSQQGCSGGEGGGIMVENGAAGLQISGNRILSNIWPQGAGMEIRAFGNALIQNNLIMGNIAKGNIPASLGGGMLLQVNATNVLIIQNVVVANQADQGAGIYWAINTGTNPLMVNNTIANNRNTQPGGALYITGSTNEGKLVNNLLIGGPGKNAVFCDTALSALPPLLLNNDAFSYSGGAAYQGSCVGQTGKNGNISRDPIFSGLLINDYRIRPTSPAVDAGSNSAPFLPPTDFLGRPRIYDGNFDGTAVVDMGAYEFVPPN